MNMRIRFLGTGPMACSSKDFNPPKSVEESDFENSFADMAIFFTHQKLKVDFNCITPYHWSDKSLVLRQDITGKPSAIMFQNHALSPCPG